MRRLYPRPSLSSYHPNPSIDITAVSGKYGRQIRRPEMPYQHLSEQVTEVGGDGQIPSLKPCGGIQCWPAAEHLATSGISSDDEHGCGMSVVRTAVSILTDSAAELAHREHDHVGHAVPQVLSKCRECRSEVPEPQRKLAVAPTLIDVRIPSTHVRERDFRAEVGFDELRNLLHRLPKRAPGILGAIRRCALSRVCLLEHAHRFKCFFGRRCYDTGG